MFVATPQTGFIPTVVTGIEVADDQFEKRTERLTVYNCQFELLLAFDCAGSTKFKKNAQSVL